ncbi:alanine dehydrogenase [Candidatus Bathyarchaeota archaeon]|nr:MAG: alanine dehydrogenase [Candidatus Bathyarchaeota archaeon]
METLLLTDNEVKQLLSMSEVMEAVESAFKEKGLKRVQMPAKIYLFYKKYNGDLRTMPSYLEELDTSAVKIVNVHPDNRKKYNLPTVMAVIVLINPENGAPIAIMGGTTVTDMRTGAAGGVAAKYLARKDSKIVGLVGAGAQARTQLMALLEVYKRLEEVRVWSRSKETKQKFVAETEPIYGHLCKITAVETIKEAVEGADIVVTTTPSRQPLIMNTMVSSGTHFNCIGADAPGKEELDPTILKRAKIVVDDWEQASHSGEINVPLSQGIITKENIWAEIGEIVAGLKPGREKPDEITVFTSTGLAIQDAVTAKIAYDKAVEKKIGRWIPIT